MTVQAAAIINLISIINGSDEPGWRYLHAAIDMAQRIDLFDPPHQPQGTDLGPDQ
jgi:hypothetical protein